MCTICIEMMNKYENSDMSQQFRGRLTSSFDLGSLVYKGAREIFLNREANLHREGSKLLRGLDPIRH